MSDYILCSVKENETGMRLDQFLASMEQIVSRTQAQRLLTVSYTHLTLPTICSV